MADSCTHSHMYPTTDPSKALVHGRLTIRNGFLRMATVPGGLCPGHLP